MQRKIRQIEQLPFSEASLPLVVAQMDRMADAGDGWINLVPTISDRNERPTTLRFLTLFSGGGLATTMITWIPGRSRERGAIGPSLGITHATGHRAAAALGSVGVPVPVTWTIEQDHSRRGLILRLPVEEANEQVAIWAVRAVDALSVPDHVTSWRAEVHLPAP